MARLVLINCASEIGYLLANASVLATKLNGAPSFGYVSSYYLINQLRLLLSPCALSNAFWASCLSALLALTYRCDYLPNMC